MQRFDFIFHRRIFLYMEPWVDTARFSGSAAILSFVQGGCAHSSGLALCTGLRSWSCLLCCSGPEKCSPVVRILTRPEIRQPLSSGEFYDLHSSFFFLKSGSFLFSWVLTSFFLFFSYFPLTFPSLPSPSLSGLSPLPCPPPPHPTPPPLSLSLALSLFWFSPLVGGSQVSGQYAPESFEFTLSGLFQYNPNIYSCPQPLPSTIHSTDRLKFPLPKQYYQHVKHPKFYFCYFTWSNSWGQAYDGNEHGVQWPTRSVFK